MNAYIMTNEQIRFYEETLRLEERCEATIQKYVGAVTAFFDFIPEDKTVSAETALAWKAEISGKFSASTVNVMIAAVNRFFACASWDIRVKQLKVQRRIFRDRDRELTKTDYMRLLNEAWKQGNLRLYYLMQTLGSTGIRVSELRFITLEAVRAGKAVVDCKGKRREILIPKKLREKLLAYCAKANIASGCVFVTRNGKPLNRSNVWKQIQRLCADAGVDRRKAFPHNFRRLFAVSFYRMEKDIAKLADLLGHASINTTRIYIMESGEEHERQMERLGLVV